jgi:hypothetical protein
MGGQRHVLADLPLRTTIVPIVQEAGWVPGPVWTGAENLAPISPGPSSPQRVAISTTQSRPTL